MSECVEIFQAMKERYKEEKKTALQENMAALERSGINYTLHNNGYHAIITYNHQVADFWPSTNKYRIRPANRYRHGIRNLLHDLGYKEP